MVETNTETLLLFLFINMYTAAAAVLYCVRGQIVLEGISKIHSPHICSLYQMHPISLPNNASCDYKPPPPKKKTPPSPHRLYELQHIYDN